MYVACQGITENDYLGANLLRLAGRLDDHAHSALQVVQQDKTMQAFQFPGVHFIKNSKTKRIYMWHF
jgi:hypothetical protein